MKNALEVSHNLGLLRKYTAEITELMESGRFYRLSFGERLKLIRRIKKLYNRLLGPISPVKLRHIVAAAGVVALNTACFAPIGSTVPDYRQGGTDDPGSFTSGGAGFSLAPYFEFRGYNEFGLEPTDYDYQYGGSGFYTYRSYSLTVGRSSAFVDLDGDGDLDVVHSSVQGEGLYTETYVPGVGFYRDYSFVGGGPELWYQLNQGTPEEPSFGDRLPLPVNAVNYVGGIAFADIDGDGDYDLSMQSNEVEIPFSNAESETSSYVYANGVAFFENTGSAQSPYFVFRGAYGESAGSTDDPFDLAFGDVDLDGDLDLFVTNYYGINHYENTGSATEPQFDFTDPYRNPFGLANYSAADTESYRPGAQLVVEDLDADGDLDLVTVWSWYDGDESRFIYNELFVVLNSGDPANPVLKSFLVPEGLDFRADRARFPRVVDIDADGDLDVFHANNSPSYSGLYFLENLIIDDGESEFSEIVVFD